MSVRYVLSWLEMLLFPPICRDCGERQNIFSPTLPQPLCPMCGKRWAAEMAETCPRCGLAYPYCACMPDLLREVSCERLVKLAVYHAGEQGVVEQLLLRCKDVNDRALFRYLAADLTLPVFRALQATGQELSETVVTWAPRRGEAVRKVGHDQARKLAEALSGQLHCPCIATLRHEPGSRQQKKLTREQRVENAAHSYRPVKRSDVRGKTVLLVDDICTTGASLAACTELLLKSGAAHVIAVCVAVRG